MGDIEEFKWKGKKVLTPLIRKQLKEYEFAITSTSKGFDRLMGSEEGPIALVKNNKLTQIYAFASNIDWKEGFKKDFKKLGINLKRRGAFGDW